jgi:hypothetical protein
LPQTIVNPTEWDTLFRSDAWRTGPHRFIAFAGDGCGSHFCLWQYPDLEGPEPVVLLGSHGDGYVVASCLVEFFRGLAICGMFVGPGWGECEDEPADLVHAIENSFGATDSSPVDDLTKAIESHPDLTAFIDCIRADAKEHGQPPWIEARNLSRTDPTAAFELLNRAFRQSPERLPVDALTQLASLACQNENDEVAVAAARRALEAGTDSIFIARVLVENGCDDDVEPILSRSPHVEEVRRLRGIIADGRLAVGTPRESEDGVRRAPAPAQKPWWRFW